MKKCLVMIVLCSILGFIFTVTDYADAKPKRPVKSHYSNRIGNYDSSRLLEVEKYVFGKTFQNQNINTRLNRLEKTFFNKTYPGTSVEQRINNLIVNYKNNVALRPTKHSGSKWKNFLNNVNSNFFGCPTGITPPVNPYYSYGSDGYSTNYGNYADYYGNNGWYHRNNNFGTGTGIHILD